MNDLIKINYDSENNLVINGINMKNTNGEYTVSSLEVAEHFEKQHKDVLRTIMKIIEETSAQNFANLFTENIYLDNYNRNQKCYDMTRDGFSLLVMGFTGKNALTWKMKYIEAFNKMEKLLNSPEMIMKRALDFANVKVKELECKVGELTEQNKYSTAILNNDSLMLITAIAKDYGFSGKQMNELLHSYGVQYKLGGQWLLYSKYQDKGYVHSKTYLIKRKDGTEITKVETLWTQNGRKFIYDLLKKDGIVPVIERERQLALPLDDKPTIVNSPVEKSVAIRKSSTKKVINPKWCAKMKAYRANKGLTLREVEKLTGVNHGNVWEYENGKSTPQVKNAYKLAKFYGVSVVQLTDGMYKEI